MSNNFLRKSLNDEMRISILGRDIADIASVAANMLAETLKNMPANCAVAAETRATVAAIRSISEDLGRGAHHPGG